ncbi:hypothetical protein B6U70_00130 [Euryarchaeota archaeon ex4484_162]|nr:MAG: hypothetical protein B6U70_00130 [Euryarchaeota archaeon ex4484_162]RLF61248.1 MAG: hypothetical protein DRN16_03895 [Thermoplasmata archaeon]HDM25688.1 hypothetical protein [Thermoplasmatales archaeon]
MFNQKLSLKDIIIDLLKTSEDSISGLSRKLNKNGYKLHRLILTGYLKALVDVGYLKEHEIKPSKVYSIRSLKEKKNIYELLGGEIKNITNSPDEQARICIYILQRLFHRPIFLEEIKKCKVETNGRIDAEKVEGEERGQARKLLSKTLLKLPFNDPAYVINKKIENYEKLRVDILQNIIISEFSLGKFSMKSKQIKLDQIKR